MKMVWYLKQLLPLTYRSKYKEKGVKYFCVWSMWFGKSYNIDTFEVK